MKPARIQTIPIAQTKVAPNSFWGIRIATTIAQSIPHFWQHVEPDLKALAAAGGGEPCEPNMNWARPISTSSWKPSPTPSPSSRTRN